MTVVRSVKAPAQLFLTREFGLYRLYGKDADFRSLCDDWLEAMEACEHAGGGRLEIQEGSRVPTAGERDRDGDPAAFGARGVCDEEK